MTVKLSGEIMKLILSLSFKGFLILLLLSCVNTSYSRFDEKAIDDELVDLIVGQFPHHSSAFYENELKVKEPKLKENPDDFELRNDVAVAYLKLAKWSEAIFHFKLNESKHPGQYKTNSNLGVMYKKMGQFSEAAFYIKKALEIKPGGHMGLGDYYLKMINWRQQYNPEANINFLGVSYNDSAKTAQIANKEYVITLIKNDYQFVDSYLVLGDILYEEGNLQLAIRAYIRAQQLGGIHNYGKQASIGFKKYQEAAKKLAKSKSALQVSDVMKGYGQITSELNNAVQWLKDFQDTETEMIKAGKEITFEKVREEMTVNNLYKPRIIEAVVFRGMEYDPILIFLFIIISPLVCYYIYDKRKRMKIAKEVRGTRKKMTSFRLSR